MNSKSDNMEVMAYDKTDEVIEELFESLLSRHQIGLETSMRGSDFIFDSISLLHHKCHKIDFKRRGSNIDSPDWIKFKRATINPINKNGDKCFQYDAKVALNYQKIGKNPERITKTKPFISEYSWEGIQYPSEKDDWRKTENINPAIMLNVFYEKEMEFCPAYISKHNSNYKEQIIILIISKGEGWHYLVVNQLICITTWNSFKT